MIALRRGNSLLGLPAAHAANTFCRSRAPALSSAALGGLPSLGSSVSSSGCPTSARRAFGTESVVKRLKLRGRMAQAFRQASPPRLQQKAVDHYLRVLRKRGGEDGKELDRRPRAARAPAVAAPGALTSEEKTRLVARYVPEEREPLKMLRKHSHKRLWRMMKRRQWQSFEEVLEELQDRQVPYDEVTYNLAIFGVLLHPRRDDELARQLVNDMRETGRFHPVLVRLQTGFVDSVLDLQEVEAAPNPWDLLKVAKTFWHISVNFKRLRIKQLRARLAEAAAEQRRLHGASGPVNGHLESGDSDEEDPDAELDDGQRGPRVKFPAPRPRQLKGVHKGSGVPKRRNHRWKH